MADIATYRDVLRMTQQISEHCSKSGLDVPMQVFLFLIEHGYIALPDTKTTLRSFSWLSRTKVGQAITSENIKGKIGIVLCNSDEPVPFVETLVLRSGNGWTVAISAFLNLSSRVICIPEVELGASFDLGIALLHEAWHACYRFQQELAGKTIVNCSSPSLEELKNWEFLIHILEICGEARWKLAVDAEIERIKEMFPDGGKRVGKLGCFAMSDLYESLLDDAFGHAPVKVRKRRNLYVAVAALFALSNKNGQGEAGRRNVLASMEMCSQNA